MKTKASSAIIILLILFSTFSSMAQKAGFSGEWKMDLVKTQVPDNQLYLSSIKLTLKTDSLLTTRVYENGNGEAYPFDENLSLDGNECKIVIYEMPRSSKMSFSNGDSTINITTTTTFSGNNGEDNLVENEKWNVGIDGNTLTRTFTNKTSEGEVSGTFFYNRAKN